jgi:hypothetical protein
LNKLSWIKKLWIGCTIAKLSKAFFFFLAIGVLLWLSGCAPYVGYTHLSDPQVDNDGYDLVCAGTKWTYAKAALCKNLASAGGEYIKIDLEYVWDF